MPTRRESSDNDKKVSSCRSATKVSTVGDGGGDGAGHLVGAHDFLARRLGTSADQPWSLKNWDALRATQVAALVEWADSGRHWIEADKLGLVEVGGQEHDLFPELDVGKRFWKKTKGGGFGWYPFCEDLVGRPSDALTMRFGSPFQYLNRLILLNELVQLSGEDHPFVRLEGLLRMPSGVSMITSTKFIPGQNATEAEIEKWMSERGFNRVTRDKWYRAGDNIALFDVSSSNVIRSRKGPLVPVDIIPIRPQGLMLKRILEAIRRGR